MVRKQTLIKSIKPTFDMAQLQALYRSYSTLSTENDIYTHLTSIAGEDILSLFPTLTPREIVNEIIMMQYPNEATIKAAFINNVLLSGKSHVTIFEFPVDTSRADLCKVNGCSIAYEIKTDLDNLQRLPKQLDDYSHVFEQVYLVCSKERLATLVSFIPDKYGIYSYRFYRGKYIFTLERTPDNTNSLNSRMQLSLVTKDALKSYAQCQSPISKEEIIDSILHVKNTDDINRFFKRFLKRKYADQWCFLKYHLDDILEIDYQWFFKNAIAPEIIYQKKKPKIVG